MSLHLTVTNNKGDQIAVVVLSKDDQVEIVETVRGISLLDIDVVQAGTETEGGEICLEQYMDGKYLEHLEHQASLGWREAK